MTHLKYRLTALAFGDSGSSGTPALAKRAGQVGDVGNMYCPIWTTPTA